MLYRVNAGGPALGARTRSLGGRQRRVVAVPQRRRHHGGLGQPGRRGGLLGAGEHPAECLATERWDPDTAPEMAWAFPVTAGRQVQVRLYFASRYSATDAPGDRVFDVAIDGVTRLNDYDIVADVGHNVGTMKSFTIASDGSVDITFGHVVENPLINAIEIVDPAAARQRGVLKRRPVNASGVPTAPATTANNSINWSDIRGAFYLNGTVYYGLGDGRLYARTFNTTNGALGTERAINMYDDPDNGARIPFPIENLTGMFYDPATHRLYYTLVNDASLFYRYFTPQSEILGAQTFTAASSVNFSTAAGLTLANNRVFFGSTSDGALRSAQFSAGAVTGASHRDERRRHLEVPRPVRTKRQLRDETGMGRQNPAAHPMTACARTRPTGTHHGSGSSGPAIGVVTADGRVAHQHRRRRGNAYRVARRTVSRASKSGSDRCQDLQPDNDQYCGVFDKIDSETKRINTQLGTSPNTVPMTIGGKSDSDQIETTFDYFAGTSSTLVVEGG